MRTRLITNGLDWHRLEKASQSKADAVHIELEDGIPPERKEEARQLIVRCLRELDWTGKLTMVRINQYRSGFFEDDIFETAKGAPGALILGKCEGPDDVRYADRLLTWSERKYGLPVGAIKIVASIERLKALQAIDEIATASSRMLGLSLGLSDLGNEFGYARTFRGQELETLYARSRLVMAAHLAGLLAFSPVFVYYRDLEGAFEYARWAYTLGFDVGTCLSPNQIEVVAKAFSPSPDEIAWAKSVLDGEHVASKANVGAWTGRGLGAENGPANADVVMMDAPHSERARRIMKRAEQAGLP